MIKSKDSSVNICLAILSDEFIEKLKEFWEGLPPQIQEMEGCPSNIIWSAASAVIYLHFIRTNKSLETDEAEQERLRKELIANIREQHKLFNESIENLIKEMEQKDD